MAACVICGTQGDLESFWRHPWKENQTACEDCYRSSAVCSFCENYTIGHLGGNDLLVYCPSCQKVPPIDPEFEFSQIINYVYKTLDSYTSICFSSLQQRPLRYRLASQKELAYANKFSPNSKMNGHSTTFGATLFYNNSNVDILISAALPPLLAAAFIAHEMVHAWLHFYRKEIPKRTKTKLKTSKLLYEEGLCHVASWIVLTETILNPPINCRLGLSEKRSDEEIQETQAKFWLEKFFRSIQPVFAEGFATAKAYIRQHGWETACLAAVA